MEPGKVATNSSRLVLVGFCCERNRFNRRTSLAAYSRFFPVWASWRVDFSASSIDGCVAALLIFGDLRII
jgi:hypothetical protein